MSIDGRINVDVLFHDKDGTSSLKVVSLEKSTAVTSGKIAVVSGTAGTSYSSVSVSPSTYRDASGAIVSFASLDYAVIKSVSGFVGFKVATSFTDPSVVVPAGHVAAIPMDTADFEDSGQLPAVAAVNGTASYTILLYGE